MKAVKLTATAREDIEAARKNFLPVDEKDHPWDSLYDRYTYECELRGDPGRLKCADRLLGDNELWTRAASEPVIFPSWSDYKKIFQKYSDGTLLLYQNCFYAVRGQLLDEQRRLLVLEAADKERQLFERLKAKFQSPQETTAPPRQRIPEAVRVAVWRRDQGRCSNPGCGSRTNLEYDHIIPVANGGPNTERNVELLCETCNRRKSSNIQ